MSVMMVVTTVSRRVGQTTFETSARTCWRNVNGFVFEAKVDSFAEERTSCFQTANGREERTNRSTHPLKCTLSIAGKALAQVREVGKIKQ